MTTLRGHEFNVDEYEYEASSDGGFADQRFGLFVFLVAGGVAIVILALLTLRECYWKKYGRDLCLTRRRRTDAAQLGRDRALAEALQRQLNEEEREAGREAKRKERRLWYESYIIPFTMVSDLLSVASHIHSIHCIRELFLHVL